MKFLASAVAFFRLFARAFAASAPCVLVVGLLQCAQAVSAQAPSSPPQEAVEHYNRGRDHYQAGRYREALTELEASLTLDPRSPNLVYNVARVHELLGQLDKASEFYARYRDMLPPGEREERERVEAILLRLQGAQQEVRPAGTDGLRSPEQPMRKERGVADAAFWTMAGVGAAALITSAVTGGFALKSENDADAFVVGSTGSAGEREDLVKRADRLALTSDVTFLIGTTFAVTSVLLYMLRERDVPVEQSATKRTNVGLAASHHGFILSLGASL